MRNVATSINGFTFDLYGQLRNQEGNLFFSPASISTALAMTSAGAAGQTEKEMAHVLHCDRNQPPLSREQLHDAYGKLTSLLNSSGGQGGYVLRTANRLWGQQSYAFLPAFLKLTRDNYGAELAELDFGRQNGLGKRSINGSSSRHQKIVDLIPIGVLGADTRLVLTNAIYFLGGWDEEFSKESTKDEPFFVTPKQPVAVPLMAQTERFRYGESEDLQILELPYRGREISMIVLLPKQVDGLAALSGQLTIENFDRWTGSLRSRKVQVFLPKFKITSQFSLKKVLSAMGMPTAFTEAADFSKMASKESLMISEVVHKAYVDVNEKGTEAAAATAVIIAPTSAPFQPEPPVIFRADHPFVFLLRDNRTGTMLFVGRVSNPK